MSFLFSESIYRQFIKHVSFPLIAYREGLPNILKHLKQLEKSQYWPLERIQHDQFMKIKSILIHAYENTEFYRKRFDESGFDPMTFRDISEFAQIPLLSKKDIRENLKALVAKNYVTKQLHTAETGGTTGVKMRFYRNNECLAPKEASLLRFEKWAGWDIGDKIGIVWTAQQDYVGNWTLKSKIKNALYGRQVVFPAAIVDKELMNSYVNQLIVKRPTIIRAFTSPILEVAKYIETKKIEHIKLKGVITTGEPLYDYQRNVISNAFDCEVFDSYRARETGPIAQECNIHKGLHINAESLYVETVKTDDIRVNEEGLGEIVVTDLLNYGMPLIRYKMGDYGILSEAACCCGRSLPLLSKIIGRTADTLRTPQGKKITAGSLVLYLVDNAPGLIGQMQIIQDEIDHLLIKLTNDPRPSSKIIEYQRKTINRLFGDGMRTTFELVDEIPLEKSGKYRFTICKI